MALIRGMSDPVKGKIFAMENQSMTVGRGNENKVCVPDPSVSINHCIIEREGDKYTVRDLNSTNGTRLNGENIKKTRLKPKDLIQVGSVDFMFDGTDVQVEPETVSDEKSHSPALVTHVEEHDAGTMHSSSAFGKKRDHRRFVNAMIFLIAAMALALLVAFVLMLRR